MTKLDRLFAILLHLHARRRVRAQDLAQKFEVSERTIYRDMKALGEMGIPITALAGTGYALMEGFQLPPLILSPDEGLALTIGARMFVRYASGKISRHAEVALQKIEAVLPPPTRQHAQTSGQLIEFFPPQHRLNFDSPNIQSVLDAISTRRVLSLRYQDRDERITEREVEPERLNYSDGAWYITGYCRLRASLRSFRLNRVVDLRVTDEKFTPRLIYPTTPILQTVHIRFSKGIISRVRERQHYGFTHEESSDIWVYQVNQFEEITPWIMAFGAQAEVLSPPELRARLRQEAETLIKLLT